MIPGPPVVINCRARLLPVLASTRLIRLSVPSVSLTPAEPQSTFTATIALPAISALPSFLCGVTGKSRRCESWIRSSRNEFSMRLERLQLAQRCGDAHAFPRATDYRLINPHAEPTKRRPQHDLSCLTETICRPCPCNSERRRSTPLSSFRPKPQRMHSVPVNAWLKIRASRPIPFFPRVLAAAPASSQSSPNPELTAARNRLTMCCAELAKPRPECDLNCLAETVSDFCLPRCRASLAGNHGQHTIFASGVTFRLVQRRGERTTVCHQCR